MARVGEALMGTIHIIGAGLSGLSAAVKAAAGGHQVALYESTANAGGRARSFHDDGLGCVIDNGNHLLLGANHRTRTYLETIGAAGRITEVKPARFPFFDPKNDLTWSLRPGSPWLPLWMLSGNRRVPGTSMSDLRDVWRICRSSEKDTVADCVNVDGPLYERLWQPMCRAILNTDASEASARLMKTVIRMTFLKSESACRPLMFSHGLSAALVNPALTWLERKGATTRFQARVRGLRIQDDQVIALRFAEGLLRVDQGDAVILAVPPDICADLWPDANPPQDQRPIVNVHFRLAKPLDLPTDAPFLGMINTDAHWIFIRDNVISVTISDAGAIAERPNWEVANQTWSEIAKATGRNMGRLPPWRVIKERRATIAQTPAIVKARPGSKTSLDNMFLAGDWTDTGLPATIEGSIYSGNKAAALALRQASRDKPD